MLQTRIDTFISSHTQAYNSMQMCMHTLRVADWADHVQVIYLLWSYTNHLLKFQEVTPEADIISTRYTKSVIKSCAALSYIEAQARMDDRCYFIQFWLTTVD